MPADLRTVLLARARLAIDGAFGQACSEAPQHPALDTPGACFVTLTHRGSLRGCIGTLEAHRSLAEDLEANARAAAFSDPRFPPLSKDEWDDTRLEVSLLGPLEWRTCPTEESARSWIVPGESGVVLAQGGRRATFLPQVWRQLPEPTDFLHQLRIKAGMDPDFWPGDMRVARYSVAEFHENKA